MVVTFSRDLTGLMHINAHGINVTLLKQQSDKTRIVPIFFTGFCGHLPRYRGGMASIVSQIVAVLVNRELSE